MNKFKLKTKYECLVKNKEDEILLSPYETLEFGEEDKLFIYPLNKPRDFLPFTVNGKNLKNCPYYKFISFEDDTLVCLSNQTNCENYSISKIRIQGQELEFQVGESKLIVTYKDWRKIITLDEEFNKYVTGHKNDIAYVKFSTLDNDTLYAFNIKTGKARQFKGREIVINNDGFEVKNHDIMKKYTIGTQGLKSQHEDSLEKDYTLKPEKAGCLFLEHIKSQNYQNALNLCSQSLQEKISKDTLKDFFSGVLDYYYISPTTYALQTNKSLKICKFTLYGSQIDDIDL